jgi:Zn-dependent protease with chaperone function
VDIDRFKSMVARLEQESAMAPRRYRVKVALLALLGFAILALVLATVGFGLVALAGIAGALAFSGGAAFLLLLKLGKLLFLLAVPLWFTLKSAVQALFVRLPAPRGREITRAQAPALFAALDDMRAKMGGPRFHHVLVVNDLNAAVVQRPAFGLVGWPRNYLLLGLPLLECMTPIEAMAVVAHEYGHLAGSHGRFSAFIYRLRHTWGTLQAHMDHFQGWLARLVAPLVRWYAPYFNAYTYVLARADEYNADAASAQLVGAGSAAHALKRVNLAAPQYQQFLKAAYRRVGDEAVPPRDLPHAWASHARIELEEAQGKRWLDEALDREGHVTDTHPTLRARLSALEAGADGLEVLPPVVEGPTASQAWFGAELDALRRELGEGWAAEVADGWTERYTETQTQRGRLAELRGMASRDAAQGFELLRLAMDLEPDTDLRQAFADFNAAHPDHAPGLFYEAVVRLDRGEREGLALLERAMEIDPEATRPACERAHAFLTERGETELAETYAERWRRHEG